MGAINLGKREPGPFTAVSPGDTLYFPFETRDGVGAPVAFTGLVVGDIEVFKNGSGTPRATDSGYSIGADTGQLGSRVGLGMVSVQLFNTADDAAFYAAGAQYAVAIDAITVNGQTQRFYIGTFEIGRYNADIRAVLADTGAAHLDQGRYGVISDSGRQAAVMDTGKAAAAIWTSHATRTLTAFALDTGIAQTVWRESRSTYTDTGSFGKGVDVHSIRSDTGVADNLKRIAGDTGTGSYIPKHVWNETNRTLTAFALDTGVAHSVWNFGGSSASRSVNIARLEGDTGASVHLAQAFNNAHSVANQIDANIQSVNDVTVNGVGTAASPWGP